MFLKVHPILFSIRSIGVQKRSHGGETQGNDEIMVVAGVVFSSWIQYINKDTLNFIPSWGY